MSYNSSLTNSQWEVMKVLFENYGYVDEGREHPIRLVVNAILYLVNNGTKWRELPKDFPPWQSVYYHFSKWSKCGLWAKLGVSLAEIVREHEGREQSPSLISIDSQTLSGEPGIEERGLDGNKKINGRKRHIAVDVNGFIFACGVTPANEHDLHMGSLLVKHLNQIDLFPRIEKILGDNAYASAGKGERISVTVESKERAPGQRGFVPEAFRWAVERTFAWLNRQRRIVRNYEKKILNQVSMTFIGGIRIVLSRLEKALKNAQK